MHPKGTLGGKINIHTTEINLHDKPYVWIVAVRERLPSVPSLLAMPGWVLPLAGFWTQPALARV